MRNKGLRVDFAYVFRGFSETEQYPTLEFPTLDHVRINPSFGISISEGWDQPNIFFGFRRYYTFVTLFNRSVKLIMDDLHNLFPNIGSVEFEIDQYALQRFQAEKSLAVGGFETSPCVIADSNDQCCAGIRITHEKGSISIPLEDAIPLAKLFDTFDPINASMNCLKVLGKIE